IPTDTCGVGTFNSFLTGVATRKVSGPKMPTSQWSYSSSLSSSPAYVYCENNLGQLVLKAAPSEEAIVTATDPLGNVTDNYYSVWPMTSGESLYDAGGNLLNTGGNSPNGFTNTEYGLPFTHNTSNGGRLLSRHVYTSAGYAASPKTPLRSSYVTYEH